MVIINYTSTLPNNFTGVTYSSVKIFIKNKEVHRYYGAAAVTLNKYKQWWFNNKHYGNATDGYTQKQFLKDINKQWLL